MKLNSLRIPGRILLTSTLASFLCICSGYAESLLGDNFNSGTAPSPIGSPWATQGGPGSVTYNALAVAATGTCCAKVTNNKTSALIGNFQFNRPLATSIGINSGDQIFWSFSLNIATMSASTAAQTTVRLTGTNGANQEVNILALNVFPDRRAAVSTSGGTQEYFKTVATSTTPSTFLQMNYNQWYDFRFELNTITKLFNVSVRVHGTTSDVGVLSGLTIQNAVDIRKFDSFIGSQNSYNNTFYLDDVSVRRAVLFRASDSISASGTNDYAFDPPASSQRMFLTLRAWINVAATGSAKCMRILVNKHLVDGDHLVSKPPTFQTRNGQGFEWCDVSSWKIWRLRYGTATPPANCPAEASPTGTAPSDIVTADSTLFTFDITDYLYTSGTERNIMCFDNSTGNSIKFVEAAVTTGTWTMPPPVAYGTAPTGIIPTYPITPTGGLPLFTGTVSSNGTLIITTGGQTYLFTSGFSYPNSSGHFNVIGDAVSTSSLSYSERTWTPTVTGTGPNYQVTALGASYALSRDIHVLLNRVDVEDTLTSIAPTDLGIAMRHECRFPSVPATTMVAGMKLPTKSCAVTDFTQENPSVYFGLPGAGIGIIPRDDVMRLHSTKFIYTPNQAYSYASYAPNGFAGLYDYRYALGGESSYVSRWSIVPLANDDYWQFVKIVRKMTCANFPIPGCFSFTYTKSNFQTLSTPDKKAYVDNRGVKYISSGVADWMTFDGTNQPATYAQGTAIPYAPNWMAATVKMMNDFKSADPAAGVQKLLYFHAFLSSEANAWSLYHDDRLLDANQNQYTYTGGARSDTEIAAKYYPIFYPCSNGSVDNSYASKLETVLTAITGTDGFDGVFWDEFSKSSVMDFYSPTIWDGHTGLFDFTKFNILTRMNDLTLISQQWRLDEVKRLQKNHKMVVGNTEPYTETESAVTFPRVVETNPISNLSKTHFYSPIGLGDIIQPGATEDDLAQQIRRHLDNAALYYYYETGTPMTHPNLTSRMFPFTPVEIRPGVLIGAERILLSTPACVGWGDDKTMANSEIHIYDEKGKELLKPEAEADVDRDMNNGTPAVGMTTVRLPLGYTAVIIRPQ